MMRTRILILGSILLTTMALFVGCSDDFDGSELEGQVNFDPNRPSFEEGPTVEPYSGDDPIVMDAQERFKTGYDMHQKIIFRTCTPFDGVCHNQKEYPDLHTPGAFLATIAAPCNVQAGEWESVFDRCEQLGDRFKIEDNPEVEVGWIALYQPEGEFPDYGDGNVPTAESPGLHVTLRQPVNFGERTSMRTTGRFVRTFVNDQGNLEDLNFASMDGEWWVIEDGTHLVLEVRDRDVGRIQDLLEVGVTQGDLNRNGVFGFKESDGQVPLIFPGNPEESYLIARLRGTMLGHEVPGSRMPLANKPLDIAEMLALFCYVEGLEDVKDFDSNLSWDIDYNKCSYSEDPASLNLLGEGVTWETRVSKILEFNCGGCHSNPSPAEGLNLVGDDVYARLLQPSMQNPDMPLITPEQPMQSYLYLKLIGHEDITGLQMPFNPLTGEGELQQAELADIETWIVAGAVENE